MLCQNKDGLSLKRNDMGWKNSKQEKGCKKKKGPIRIKKVWHKAKLYWM